MSARLIPGEVVRIRVNPRDCIRVTKLMHLIGAADQHLSFSSAVSLALSSLLQAMVESNRIQDSDGFDFAECMASYKDYGRSGKKLDLTRNIRSAGDEFQVKSPPLARHAPDPTNLTRMQYKAKMLLEELQIKARAASESLDEMDTVKIEVAGRILMDNYNPTEEETQLLFPH